MRLLVTDPLQNTGCVRIFRLPEIERPHAAIRDTAREDGVTAALPTMHRSESLAKDPGVPELRSKLQRSRQRASRLFTI
jgi:hypothetical protein